MVCATCTVNFERLENKTSKSGLRFCSVKCRNRHLSIHQKDRIERVPREAPPGALYRYIPVGPETYAIVDREDFAWLSQWKWHTDAYGYVVRPSSYSPRSMHRLLTNSPKGMPVDHCNGDKLDNRRTNLRLCDNTQNTRNMKMHRDNQSGYKGISFDKQRPKKPYQARICVDRKTYILGRFATPEEAALAYNEAALKYHGEFARLNVVEFVSEPRAA